MKHVVFFLKREEESPPPTSPVMSEATRSLSQSLSRDSCHSSLLGSLDSSSTALTSSTQFDLLQYATTLAERLNGARKRIQELENTSAEWRTQCHAMCGVISQLQNQLQANENRRDTPRKRTRVEAWVLAQAEAQKATEDRAWLQRRVDGSRVFTGPLNKSRRKQDLKDIANALALLDVGKKDHLLDRISKHFNEHPDLKTSPRFEGLFNPRPRKRIRLTYIPVANP